MHPIVAIPANWKVPYVIIVLRQSPTVGSVITLGMN